MTVFQEKYNSAPMKIQELVSSENTSETLADIALINHIGDEGFGNKDFGRLVGRTLIGMSHPKDFVPFLEKKLKISNESARKIAVSVNKEIFSQVKDELVELYNLGDQKEQQDIDKQEIETGVKTYQTPPELLERKLSQSVVMQKVEEQPQKTTPENKQIDTQKDSYREPII